MGGRGSSCGRNRALTVNLKCENNAASVPRSTDVTEYTESGCAYELTVSSMHGCPIGCGAFANSLCASQGLCGYDYATNRSRCFCYWGYSGSMCETPQLSLMDFGWKPSAIAPDIATGPYVNTYSVQIPLSDPYDGIIHNHVVNVTYDLSKVYNIKTVYQINDTAEKNNDYQYYFNIGGTVDSSLLPSACHQVIFPCLNLNNRTECRNLKSANVANLGYAFRYKNGSMTNTADECILLGTDVLFSNDASLALYDNLDNPAHGIKLYYGNGSYDEASNTNCGITLSLICPDTRQSYKESSAGIVIDASEVEKVNNECEYAATFETALACPYNCISRVNDPQTSRVCNGRGMCVADPKLGFVRCVCDELYYGDDCRYKYEIDNSEQGNGDDMSHSEAGFKIVIGLISVFLIGFVIAVAYLYMRNKKLERYAVPILDEHEQSQIEPRVPEYSDDSDDDRFNNNNRRAAIKQEMVTISTSIGNKLKSKMKQQKRTKKRGKNKYEAQEDDYSDDDDDGPSAYLAANRGNDSDSDTD